MKAIVYGMVLWAFAQTASASTTAMNYVETAAHKAEILIRRGEVDASYQTNIDQLKVVQSVSGAVVTLSSAAPNSSVRNELEMQIDQNGDLVSFTDHFIGASSPKFVGADAITLLDLGAEAIVDHLAESNDLPVVAENAVQVNMTSTGTDVTFAILLNDGRIYNVLMSADDGSVIQQGF